MHFYIGVRTRCETLTIYLEFRAPKFAIIGHAQLNYSIVLTQWQPVIVFVCPPTLSIHCFCNPLKHQFPHTNAKSKKTTLPSSPKRHDLHQSSIPISQLGRQVSMLGIAQPACSITSSSLMKVFVNVKLISQDQVCIFTIYLSRKCFSNPDSRVSSTYL